MIREYIENIECCVFCKNWEMNNKILTNGKKTITCISDHGGIYKKFTDLKDCLEKITQTKKCLSYEPDIDFIKKLN